MKNIILIKSYDGEINTFYFETLKEAQIEMEKQYRELLLSSKVDESSLEMSQCSYTTANFYTGQEWYSWKIDSPDKNEVEEQKNTPVINGNYYYREGDYSIYFPVSRLHFKREPNTCNFKVTKDKILIAYTAITRWSNCQKAFACYCYDYSHNINNPSNLICEIPFDVTKKVSDKKCIKSQFELIGLIKETHEELCKSFLLKEI